MESEIIAIINEHTLAVNEDRGKSGLLSLSVSSGGIVLGLLYRSSEI
jgi:hypothetical protein